MSSAATEAEILAGVERWAKARDWWEVDNTEGPNPWWVGIWGRSVSVQTPRPDKHLWMLPPALALAWALTVETAPEPVDVGRCPACDGKRVQVNKNGAWSSEREAKSSAQQLLDHGVEVTLDYGLGCMFDASERHRPNLNAAR